MSKDAKPEVLGGLPERCIEHMVRLQRMEEKLDRLCLLISGNGKPQEGIIVRFDRLEQQAGYLKQKAQKKLSLERGVLLAVIGSACTVIIKGWMQ